MENAPAVLLVESDPVQRDLIALALRRLQITAVQTGSGASVRPLVEKLHPDLLLLDLYLPDMNGLDLLRQAHEAGWLGRTAVIAISSLAFGEVVTQAAALGARSFLVKPIDTDLLVERVQQVLKRQRLDP